MKQFIQFGLAGLPAFLIAIPLNIFLVQYAHWPKPVAYVPVIWLQFTAGFLMNHYLVFKTAGKIPFWRAYFQFAASMGIIRIFDWSAYTAATVWAHVPFVLAQICCSGVFLVIKYLSARPIFRHSA